MDRKSNPHIIRSYGSTAFSPPVPTQIQVEEGGVRIIKLVVAATAVVSKGTLQPCAEARQALSFPTM